MFIKALFQELFLAFSRNKNDYVRHRKYADLHDMTSQGKDNKCHLVVQYKPYFKMGGQTLLIQ